MKNLIFLISVILTLFMLSCNDDQNADVSDVGEVEKVKLKGFEELNLSEWGFDLKVMVPKGEINGAPTVVLTERGALEIVVGVDFGLEIIYGDADFELLKTDLKEDLVFTSEILKEENNAIIYSQDIPDSGVKTQNHFLYKAVVDNNVYEVRDIMDREYGSGMIEKMLSAAKTIKSSKEEESV